MAATDTTKEQTMTLTSTDRRRILAAEYRIVLANITPNMGDRYSGQQLATAKGIARKRALATIDAKCR